MSQVMPEILYSYWDKLPVIKSPPKDVGIKLVKKDVRQFIIQAISKGVDDSGRPRHALSANEIEEYLSNRDYQIKKSSLYYQIQILVDLGLVQEISTINKGRNLITYFGRTSKLIMFGHDHDDKTKTKKSETNPDFEEFLRRMAEKNTINADIEKLSQELKAERDCHSKQVQVNFSKWIANYAEELQGLNFDLLELNKLYVEIKKYSDPYVELLKQLEHILHIDRN